MINNNIWINSKIDRFHSKSIKRSTKNDFSKFCQNLFIYIRKLNFWLGEHLSENGHSSESGQWYEIGHSSENQEFVRKRRFVQNGHFFKSGLFWAFLTKKRNFIFPCRIFDQKLSNAPISNHTKFCMTYSGLFLLAHIWKNAFLDSENFLRNFLETITAKGEHVFEHNNKNSRICK